MKNILLWSQIKIHTKLYIYTYVDNSCLFVCMFTNWHKRKALSALCSVPVISCCYNRPS